MNYGNVFVLLEKSKTLPYKDLYQDLQQHNFLILEDNLRLEIGHLH